MRRCHRGWALALLLTLPLAPHGPAQARLVIAWEDDFAEHERARLTRWLVETHGAVESLVGPFPMTVQARMHRRGGARGPVPWANTRRYGGQGVHFHVDPRHSAETFRADWTAPHELSHLILPYLGRRHAWFAEGFASFMQYRVMQVMGVLTEAEAAERYRSRIERARRGYPYPRESLAAAAPRLRASGRHPVMYWGGAVYFLRVDAALAASGSSLEAVLRDYLRCCRRDRDDLDGLLEELDRLAGDDVFTEHYRRFLAEPGFPEWHGSVDQTLGPPWSSGSQAPWKP